MKLVARACGAVVAVLAVAIGTSTALAAGTEYISYSSASAGVGSIGRVAVDGTGNNASFIATGAGFLAASATNLYRAVPPVSGPSYVGRANIDGTGANTSWLDQGGNNSPGVAINSRYVFCGVNIGGADYIVRANLDGTGNNPRFLALVGLPAAYAVAADENHVYWAGPKPGPQGICVTSPPGPTATAAA